EDGLQTLINNGQLPETDHYPRDGTIETWKELIDILRELVHQPHDWKTIVLDTLNGAERLCHEKLCREQFGNDWGREGFLSFGQGPRSAITMFTELLTLLDKCREKGIAVICLAHSAPRSVRNPEGAEYEKW